MLVDILQKIPTEFETARTQNRMMRRDDAAQMLHVWSDPDVTRFMNIENFSTIDQAREIILAILQEKTANRYIIMDKMNSELIGSFGINELDLNTLNAEIGYELKKSYWGSGIMSEVLQTFMHITQSTTGILTFTAKVDPENRASIKLLEKLGFDYDKTVTELDMNTKTLKNVKQYSRGII
ncbi:GNAT family N-acetyltransferase [Listeria rustica]|uniref:GNAT family N-acetyltransferase n=1 Tax=Listeria rustica TaxID=2713503 RepID=A0A7W1YH46_9LIST|nr:GNAT family N-acetyltransferase [Listeria rustica]MBA3927331.1 GNAT family N-acetyltransferase [Listeria rustica]